jgi:hypothetical protein
MVVVMVPVVVAPVTVVPVVVANAMMMVVMMGHSHLGCIRACRADDGHRQSKGNHKPEGRHKGLIHGSFPFSRADLNRIDSPTAAPGITLLNFFASISRL